jgi:hypothetical protein
MVPMDHVYLAVFEAYEASKICMVDSTRLEPTAPSKGCKFSVPSSYFSRYLLVNHFNQRTFVTVCTALCFACLLFVL